MKLAVISDTHDHKDNILKAVSIMNERKVDALIHCGDYVAPFVKRWFDGLNDNIKENFFGVFGNNDGERVFLVKNLGQICDIVGMEINKDFDGKKVYAAHMPTQKTIDAIAKSGQYDIILTGHTHNMINKEYENGVLVVNPGEACGYLTGKSTFAIIDTDKMKAEIIEI
ncbi:MAG: metallophosphoesterase [Promethearchaeota archaeon]